MSAAGAGRPPRAGLGQAAGWRRALASRAAALFFLSWCKLVVSRIGLGLVAGLLCYGVAHAKPEVGDLIELPAVTLMDGRELPAGYFTGKPVIVQYWASWCPFCARQNPYLQKLFERAQGTGLEILTVSIDNDPKAARQYLQDKHYSFPAAMETGALRSALGKRKVIPHILVIKADGRLAESIPGEMFEEDVLDLIKYAPKPPAKP
jgi:thiol-disulfide isomerase/thioredoxin